MKRYPDCDARATVDRAKKRLRVDLGAETACGPEIHAHHTIRLLTLEEPEIRSATTLGIAMARPKLTKEHERVVKACRKANKHNH